MHRAVVILSVLIIVCQQAAALHGSSYLGCFSFPRLLYLKGVEGVKGTQYNKDSISTCFSKCKERGYSMSIVATDYRCWCSIATPPAQAMTDSSACAAGSSKGALVFYHYEGTQACRIQELEVEPSNFFIAPQTAKGNVVFDALGQSMGLTLNTNSGAKVTANFPAQTYGQIEVLARVSVHPSMVTSIDIQEAGQAGPQAKGSGSEDISWQFYNTTAAGIGKNMLLGTAPRAKAAASILEVLLKPGQYKTVGGLKFEENVGTTWVTYTIDWQSDRVSWAMNGVPLWTKWKGSQAQIKSEGSKATTGARNEAGKPAAKAGVGVSAGNLLSVNAKQQEQQKRARARARKQTKVAQVQQQDPPAQQQPWTPPSKPAQLSFNVRWIPRAGVGSGAQIAAEGQQHPAMQSSFMEVKRIVCDKARVRGDPGPVPPTWFLLGPNWNQQQPKKQPPQQQQQQQQPTVRLQGGKHRANKGKEDAGGEPGVRDKDWGSSFHSLEDAGGNFGRRKGSSSSGGGGPVKKYTSRKQKECVDCHGKGPYKSHAVEEEEEDEQEQDFKSDDFIHDNAPAWRPYDDEEQDWPLGGGYYQEEDIERLVNEEHEDDDDEEEAYGSREAYHEHERESDRGWRWTYDDRPYKL